MSIPVPITKEQVKKLSKLLKNETEVVCLDETTHLRALLVGQSMLLAGKPVKAKIIKGY